MRSIKKAAAVVFAVMTTVLMSTAVWAASSGTCGDGVNYTLNDSGVLTITGNGKIDNCSFEKNTDIKRIVISGNITEIGSYAFDGCSNCTSVNITTDSNLKISSGAFESHSNLKAVSVSSSGDLNIGNFAFKSVSNPNYIPNVDVSCTGSLTIGNSAFMTYGNTNITTIKLHSPNIVSIGNDAFFNYGTLSSLTFESLPMQFTVGSMYYTDSNDLTVTVPTNSTMYTPKGYAKFNDPDIQKDYIDHVICGSDTLGTFLSENYHNTLTEGVDYTLTANAQTVSLTSANANLVFGENTTVKFQNYSSIWTYYTVTFKANGHGTAPVSQNVLKGQKVKYPKAPTASGYEFDGWYKEAACINPYDFNTSVTSNLTLYAKWLPYYTVTFNTNGHGTAPEAETVLSGDKSPIPDDPEANGYKFMGWYREAACVNEFDFYETPITANTTLYAKWDKAVETVEISGIRDLYSGENPYFAITLSVSPESECEISDIDWYEDEDGSMTERLDEESSVSTGELYVCNITLTAKDGYYFTDDTKIKMGDENLSFYDFDAKTLDVCTPAVTVLDAEISGTAGSCEWTFSYVTKTLTISGSGEMPDFTETDRPSWEYLKGKIEKVVTEDGITTVGAYAFYDYTALEQVSLPDSIIWIKDSAFDGSGLTSVVIPKNVSTIGWSAFMNCSQLEKAYFVGENFVIINRNAFFDAPLKYVVLKNKYVSVAANYRNFGYVNGQPTEGFTIYGHIDNSSDNLKYYADQNGFAFVELGNVDLDEENNADEKDAALLLKYINGTVTALTESQLIAARAGDPTKDEPDMLDVIAILNT